MNVSPITAEVNGQEYSGTYSVQGNTVSVSSAYGSKTTQRGGMNALAVAEMLLRELARQHGS
jgi:hypothetical protein